MYETKRGLTESLGLKLWWVLAALAQVITTYDRASKPGGVALAFEAVELLLCVVSAAAYLAPSGRRGSTREPPLLSEEDGISMVGGGGRFARSLSTREPSPEDQVGIIGWLAFSWFTPIVDLAFQRDKESGKLEPTDVYPLTNRNVANRQLERLDQQWQVELQKEKPALLSAMTRAFFTEVFSTAWVKLLNDVLHFVGPFLLNRIINFVKGTGEEAGEELWVGYAYAIGMVLSSACQAFLMAHYFQGGYQTGMRLRTALILMSYSKALRVLPWPSPAPEEAAVPAEPETRRCCKKKPPKKKPSLPTGGMGQMTNIISADTDKFTFLMPYFNLIWSCPLQIIICFIMLFNYVSWSLFAGVVVMIGFTIVSSTVAGKARKIQQEAMKAKDERLKMEVELLKIVKIIKFYAWELAIEDKVKQLRNQELALQLRYKLWNVALFLSFSLSPVLVALGTFACYTLAEGKNLDAATAFTSLSLFNILSFPLGAMPMMARFFMEAAVAKDRIEAFLLSPEVSARPTPAITKGQALEIKASKLQWPDKTLLLEEVEISVAQGDMLVIVGKTGAGKSGLLYALLGELPIPAEDGKTYLTGSIGYCAQSAWIRNATLRDNITNSPSLEADERYEADGFPAHRRHHSPAPKPHRTKEVSEWLFQMCCFRCAACGDQRIYLEVKRRLRLDLCDMPVGGCASRDGVGWRRHASNEVHHHAAVLWHDLEHFNEGGAESTHLGLASREAWTKACENTVPVIDGDQDPRESVEDPHLCTEQEEPIRHVNTAVAAYQQDAQNFAEFLETPLRRTMSGGSADEIAATSARQDDGCEYLNSPCSEDLGAEDCLQLTLVFCWIRAVEATRWPAMSAACL
eukprot:s7103_g3.t1